MLGGIQILRAAAALLIVTFHTRELTPTNALLSWEACQAGVDIFFVISGFVITYVTREESVGSFLLKRGARIIPLYWTLTLVVFVAAQFAPTLLSEGAPGWRELALSLGFIPHANIAGEWSPIIFLGWTLNYEVFFYLLFASFLWVGPFLRVLGIGFVLVALVCVGFVSRPQDVIGFTYTDPIVLEFALGAALALGLPRMPPPRASLSLILIAVSLVLLAWSETLWPGIHRSLKWGVPGAALVAGVVLLEFRTGWRLPMLERIGDASYAIYLVHPFVIEAAQSLLPAALPANLGADLAINGMLIGAILAISFGVHYALERPVLRWARSHLITRRQANQFASP